MARSRWAVRGLSRRALPAQHPTAARRRCCSPGLRKRGQMKFGYFTLSDNHYADNRRSANQFVADILDEVLYAEELGLHSAWIGEHHFSTLGVNSSPEVMLTFVAARTKNIRLAPAVTVL